VSEAALNARISGLRHWVGTRGLALPGAPAAHERERMTTRDRSSTNSTSRPSGDCPRHESGPRRQAGRWCWFTSYSRCGGGSETSMAVGLFAVKRSGLQRGGYAPSRSFRLGGSGIAPATLLSTGRPSLRSPDSGVSGSNSAEFATAQAGQWRAVSMTMHCKTRHRPESTEIEC